MIKKYSLVFIALLCSFFYGFGQIYTEDFTGQNGKGAIGPTPTIDLSGVTWNLDVSSASLVANTDWFQVVNDVLEARDVGGLSIWYSSSVNISGYTNVSFSIDVNETGDHENIDYVDVEYSTDGGSNYSIVPNWNSRGNSTHTLIGDKPNDGDWGSETISVTGLSGTSFILKVTILNNAGSEYIYLDNIVVDGTIACTDTLDFNNLQTPATGNITVGDIFDVYAQAYEPGITNDGDAPSDAGTGIEAWIGFNTANTDPSTWAETDWVIAAYNTDVGNNDEYILDLGAEIASTGTYYYASRFRLNGCGFTYGGFDSGGGDGTWDGTNDINGVLTVNAHVLDFVNLQFPEMGNISLGNVHDVFAQVYEPGVTDTASSQGANIEAWIGYNTLNNDPSNLANTGWVWVSANYNPLCGTNCGTPENNDEYFIDIGSSLPVGTYYYASRFRIDSDVYNYGGYSTVNAGVTGGFWGATNGAETNRNGILTITLADIVITEIMYNTNGADDEWIEICNVSGSIQDISNYIIDVGGTTEFTFPNSTTIANGSCITISLGDGGGTEYNVDCPFTPDFTNGSGNGTLSNTNPETITLFAGDGSTVADVVVYDDSDGADGNGSSLHIIDTALDNSDAGTNWQEVTTGGSPGTNSLISPCALVGSEINVEGNLSFFPDIAGDASNTPAGFDNTLFPGTPLLSSVTKSFRIQNLGSSDLTIGAIAFSGIGAGDFTITTAPSSTVTSGNFTTFEIQFTPTVLGSRVALVSIVNNDTDEDPYEFNIEGTGLCSATHSITSFAPTSGPVGTEVTIIGTGFTAGSSVFFNGGATAVIVSQTATQLVVEVPSNASTGIITVTENGCDLESSASFTLINTAGGCTLSDLIMTEIYDQNGGSLGYIEVYNGTGSSINLTNYYIRRYGNSTNFTDGVYTDYTFSPSVSSISNNTVLYGKISTNTDTASPDFDYFAVGGFAGINGEDIFHLYNGSTLLDVYIVTETQVGYTAKRNVNTAGPNAVSNPSDWTESGTESISDLGLFPFVLTNNPSVTNQPTDVSCDADAEFEIMASPGNSGSLTYQWYYNDGTSSTWATVTGGAFPLATITGETSNTLNISNGYYNYLNYQFYCLVTEDAACSSASDAVQIDVESTTWDGSAWNNNLPDIDKIVIIDGDYDTTTSGNIEACNLIINAGKQLDVRDSTYIKVQNNVINNGILIVQTHGAFVQVDDAGTYTDNGTSSVIKQTANLNQWYEYTYWSSPVKDETVEDAFPNTPSNRRFWFNAQNYLDETREVGNNNQTLDGQDDIDDNGDDWQIASGTMTKGLGYAATSSPFGMFPGTDQATFIGEFHTGDVGIDIYKNNQELDDNNWNLIGNPYPSAIDVDLFLAANTSVDQNVDVNPAVMGLTEGAIFIWSQNTPPSNSNNGNENLNFSQSDYAIINSSTQVAGGDGEIPTRNIPSGQAFFIAFDDAVTGTLVSGTIYKGTVNFTNSMRKADATSNSQFFRGNSDVDNKLWLNLTSDNGVFSQIAVAYVNGATHRDDGSAYDTKRNISIPRFASIYTKINGVNDKGFAIQAKAPTSLKASEIISVGFKTEISVPTLYKFSIPKLEGSFFETNKIYVKDKLMNKVHDLLESDYVFTSEPGEFNKRFQIVFKSKSKSFEKTSENKSITNTLRIIEHNNGNIEFSLNSDFEFKKITIIDFQGKIIYNLATNGRSKIFNLSNLNQATYIARVELSNGSIITKKLIKRK